MTDDDIATLNERITTLHEDLSEDIDEKADADRVESLENTVRRLEQVVEDLQEG